MDDRLKLTDEQKQLMEQMRNLISQMEAAKLEMLLTQDGFLLFYNGQQVEDIHWPEYTTEDNYKMDLNYLDEMELGAIKVNDCDDFMGIEFKD